MEARDEILTEAMAAEAEKGGATSGFGNPRSKELVAVAVAVAVAEEEEEEDEEEKKEEWRGEFGSLDDDEE